MKNYKRRFVFLSCFIAFNAILIIYWRKNVLETKILADNIIQQKKGLERLVKSSSEIHRIWWEGEESTEWIRIKDQCLKKLEVTDIFDESLMRCNPLLIQCVDELFKKKKFVLDREFGYKLVSKQNFNFRNIEQGGYLFRLKDEQSQMNLDVILKDNCHESYLSQDKYTYGEAVKGHQEEYQFDILDQHIYLDKHLVANREVNDWISFGVKNETQRLKIRAGRFLFLPATDLSLNEMKNYCQFRGKELMNAHIFDAATFLPQSDDSHYTRSVYFWTKKNSEYKERCDYVFSKECLDKGKFKLNSVAPTWQGVFDSMGGVMEAFHNPIDPELNLKVSSFYFPFRSSWHQLGRRGYWTGEDHDRRSFDFGQIGKKGELEELEPSVSTISVGFRCMRRVEK